VYTPLSTDGGYGVKTGRASLGGIFFWRALGALVLGVLLAKWCWVLFAPHATVVAVAPRHEPSPEAGLLFGTGASGAVPAQGGILTDARLVGVFASTAGKPGFAVLKLGDGNQVGLALGESTPSGAKLVEVHPGYVLLERSGLRQRIDLEGQAADGKAGYSTQE
jgi:Type II secretion system protein C